jgi:hypothetical protein
VTGFDPGNHNQKLKTASTDFPLAFTVFPALGSSATSKKWRSSEASRDRRNPFLRIPRMFLNQFVAELQLSAIIL